MEVFLQREEDKYLRYGCNGRKCKKEVLRLFKETNRHSSPMLVAYRAKLISRLGFPRKSYVPSAWHSSLGRSTARNATGLHTGKWRVCRQRQSTSDTCFRWRSL